MKKFIEWAEHYGYQDTPEARADYQRYREELMQLTQSCQSSPQKRLQADLQAFHRLLDEAADRIGEMRDYQEWGEGVESVFCGYKAALEALGDAMQIALDVSIRERG